MFPSTLRANFFVLAQISSYDYTKRYSITFSVKTMLTTSFTSTPHYNTVPNNSTTAVATTNGPPSVSATSAADEQLMMQLLAAQQQVSAYYNGSAQLAAAVASQQQQISAAQAQAQAQAGVKSVRSKEIFALLNWSSVWIIYSPGLKFEVSSQIYGIFG